MCGVQSICGRRARRSQANDIALGLTWIGVFLVYGVFGFRSYLHHEVLKKEIALDRDDVTSARLRKRLDAASRIMTDYMS